MKLLTYKRRLAIAKFLALNFLGYKEFKTSLNDQQLVLAKNQDQVDQKNWCGAYTFSLLPRFLVKFILKGLKH